MPNFLAQQQGGKKTTQVHNHRISTLLLYLFNIIKVFLGVTSKSSTAFFTVYHFQHPSFSMVNTFEMTAKKFYVYPLFAVPMSPEEKN
jgi:hypothetical protein